MKLQSASRKEIRRITLGTLVCDGIMIAGLFLLSQFGLRQAQFPSAGRNQLPGHFCVHAHFTSPE